MAIDFKKATSLFAADIKGYESPYSKDGVVYLARKDYLSAKNFYKFICKDGIITSAQCINEKGGESLSESDIVSVTNCNHFVVLREDDVVEIWGTGNNIREIKPSVNGMISPSDIEVGELMDVVQELEIKLPDCRYRLSLRNIKTSECIRLGIIEFDEPVRPSLVKEKIDEKVMDKRAKKVGIKPPKLKKYKPKVVFLRGKYHSKRIRCNESAAQL